MRIHQIKPIKLFNNFSEVTKPETLIIRSQSKHFQKSFKTVKYSYLAKTTKTYKTISINFHFTSKHSKHTFKYLSNHNSKNIIKLKFIFWNGCGMTILQFSIQNSLLNKCQLPRGLNNQDRV